MNSQITVNVGIVGFGEMGKRHALEYHNATQGMINISAVVEPEDNRYKDGCKWYGKTPARYTCLKEMLEREKLDGLIISSPNCFHLENLKDCLDARLPMILEKPLESSFEKICDLVRLSDTFQSPIMVDHVMRYAPIIQKAKELINAGEIGKVCSFNFVQYHGGESLFTTFRRTLAGGGGQLVEKATHDLDIAFYLCDAAPRRVTGISRLQKFGGDKPNDLTCAACPDFDCPSRVKRGARSDSAVKDVNCSYDLCSYSKAIDTYDNEICLLDCTNNVFGVYSHCFFVKNHFSRRYEIIGTEGVIYIELSMRRQNNECDGQITLARNNPLLPRREEYKFNYEGRIHYNGGPAAGRYFYNMIRGKAEPFTTVQDAFAAEMVGIGAMKSSQEHRTVDIAQDVVPEDLRKKFEQAYSTNKSKL
jgi:predicted dehydrogenase